MEANKGLEYEDGSRKYPHINSYIINLLKENLKDASIEVIPPEGRSNFIGHGICSIAALLTVDRLSRSKDPESTIYEIKDKTKKPINSTEMFEQVLQLATRLKAKELNPATSICPEVSEALKSAKNHEEIKH